MNAPAPRPLLALVSDLLFWSKINAAAQAAGVNVTLLRDPAALPQAAGGHLLVDLQLPGAIPAAREWMRATGGRVTGFVSHVDTATIQAAGAAGITVLSRGQFAQDLPGILAAHE